mgnify:CR=1 FL=1
MHKITDRQIELLRYLEAYTQEFYCSPTYREIAERFGWASPQASLGHLRSLTRKRCVTPIVGANGVSRGYRLTPEGQRLLLDISA